MTKTDVYSVISHCAFIRNSITNLILQLFSGGATRKSAYIHPFLSCLRGMLPDRLSGGRVPLAGGPITIACRWPPSGCRSCMSWCPRPFVVPCSSNPANATSAETTLRDVQEAARAIGLQIHVLNASTSREINAAFAALAPERPDALFVA